VSAMTIRKLAGDTVITTDQILRQYSEAFVRGDLRREQVTKIMDALLDLRSAACLMSIPERKKVKS